MTLRVGLIGCGFIGGIHSLALRGLIKGGLVDARVVAVCDTQLDKAAAFGKPHGAKVVTTDPAVVFAVVDAVWICTPTNTHRALVEQAAAAGVAIYCEKPLAMALADVDAMRRLVDDAGVPHQVGLVLRQSAPFAAVAQLLAGSAVERGRVMAATLRDDQYFPNQGQYGSAWRADVRQAGGGTLLEHSIHDLDLLAWILGPIVTVSCRTANYAGFPGVEDVAVATLTHASGSTSSLVSVWHQVLARPSTRRLEVFCERSLLWVDDEVAGPVHELAGDRPIEHGTPPFGPDLTGFVARDEWKLALIGYAAAARAFCAAIAAGRAPTPGFDVALTAHRVADAAYRSAGSGGLPVEVALL